MLATLIGLVMLVVLVGGTATLAGVLLARRRPHHPRRHPAEAAVRARTRRAHRLTAEWPLLAQTLGLGYRDQWTRQHRYPSAEFLVDDQGVTATAAAIAGPAWPTTRRQRPTWPTPGAASASAPTSTGRGGSGCAGCTGIRC
jgi:hypothetical protein